MALEEEPTVVVTAAAVTGVAATGAAGERIQEVAVTVLFLFISLRGTAFIFTVPFLTISK